MTQSHKLKVDESNLIEFSQRYILKKHPYDQDCDELSAFVFSGSKVLEGSGEILVLAVG